MFLPVLVKQMFPNEPRRLDRVTLEDLDFAEVEFRNETQSLNLAGMLFIPEGDGPFPGAVIIQGSGYSRRGNGWYLTLCRHLRDAGILVLLPDKRGSEKSEGDWREASFADLATDTLAALDWLRSHPELGVSRAGVVGMSQGGWIAPLVASRTDDLAFLVSMVGAAVTPEEQLLHEENFNLREWGLLPGVSNVLAHLGSANVRYLAQPELYARIGGFDPLPLWRSLSVPSLALFGANDRNVPTQESVRRLRALRNPAITVRVYTDSGHALESPPSEGTSIIRSDALEAISSFILKHASPAAEGDLALLSGQHRAVVTDDRQIR